MTDDVGRWGSILDAPDEAVLCLAFGHRWDPGPLIERPGWGAQVWEVRASCSCGRVRSDALDPLTGNLLFRGYSGGTGPMPGAGVTRAESRQEWARRSRAKAAGVGDVGGTRRKRRRKAVAG